MSNAELKVGDKVKRAILDKCLEVALKEENLFMAPDSDVRLGLCYTLFILQAISE